MNEADIEPIEAETVPAEDTAAPVAAAAAGAPTRRRLLAKVVSDKMTRTIIVTVERTRKHRLYHRPVKSTRRYKVHDEHNEAHVGDVVEIEECRPISKETHHRLVRVVNQGMLS